MKTIDVFNELVKLNNNPETLKQRQQEIISEAIADCPKELQQRLKQNQWCLERELSKYKDPVARMNRMVDIFWRGVDDFILASTTASDDVKPEIKHDCTVIPFKKI